MILSVKKISSSVTDKDLKDLFDKYGAKRIDLKESKEKGEKFAFIDIPDKKNAEKAVKQLDGFELKGRPIRVKIKEEGTTQNKEPVKAEQKNEAQPQEKNKLSEKFPYAFFNRPPRKKPIVAFHDRLLDKHYDIAFEITWETLTPTALNPCIDEEAPSCYPKINKDDYSGYNRRWLTIDNHLAISPFTVKSAIANGFANIMGGCYRVN
ncbi:MAG TPA: RNA-binding protein, partial [Syntrophorhabdaceae bacterium]|nr:RNA-binding protein [Syntrophorhabdaceae bacterium]